MLVASVIPLILLRFKTGKLLLLLHVVIVPGAISTMRPWHPSYGDPGAPVGWLVRARDALIADVLERGRSPLPAP